MKNTFTSSIIWQENDEEQFIKCLDSLANQSLVGVMLFSESMKKIVEDNDCFRKI